MPTNSVTPVREAHKDWHAKVSNALAPRPELQQHFDAPAPVGMAASAFSDGAIQLYAQINQDMSVLTKIVGDR